jgi:hypothetical protein
MTRDDIIRMAREAGWSTFDLIDLERFAALVHAAGAAAEREAIIQKIPGGHSVDPQWVCDMIRARSQA